MKPLEIEIPDNDVSRQTVLEARGAIACDVAIAFGEAAIGRQKVIVHCEGLAGRSFYIGLCFGLCRSEMVGTWGDWYSTPKEKLVSKLTQRRDDQLKWIEECGGDLAGYIAKYGDPGVPREDGRPMLGDGGALIYKADTDRLRQIEAELDNAKG